MGETVAGTLRSVGCGEQHKVKAIERIIPDDENVLRDHDCIVITCGDEVIGDFDFGRRTRQDRSADIRLVVQQTLAHHDFEVMATLLAELLVTYVLPANDGAERDDHIKRIFFITSKFDDSQEDDMQDDEINRETIPPMTGVANPEADVQVGESAEDVDETDETETDEAETDGKADKP